MGNYASVGDSYTKGESDGRYPLNTDFENAINARYTKSESDTRFQPKGTYATLSDIQNSIKTIPSLDNTYTKVDSDGKFQPKGNYALVGASYTKAEDDAKFATFATKTDLNNAAKSATDTFATKTDLNNAAKSATDTFQPKGNYALVGASYTTADSDGRYPALATYNAAIKTVNDELADRYTKGHSDTTFATKTDLNNAASSATATFQPKGNYALVGASYTTADSDRRYPALATYNAAIKTVNDGLADRYTKGYSDTTFATKTDLNTAATNATNTFATKTDLNTAATNATNTFETKTRVQSLVSTNTLNDLKPKTMWCADGELCNFPTGKKGINWGYGGSKIYDDGHLTFETDDNFIYKFNGEPKLKINNIDNGVTIDANGSAGKNRMHISGGENLYLLNKGGVIVSRAWGGNGNLNVEGGLIVQGRDILAELNQCVRKDKKYGIRSARGGYLSDQGGWKGKPQGADWWETMYMDELPF